MDNNLNIRNRFPLNYRHQNRYARPYQPTGENFTPTGPRGRGPFSSYGRPFYSATFRPPFRNYYGYNHNTFRIQGYNRYSSRIPSLLSIRFESIIQPIQNNDVVFNASKRDPRLIKTNENTPDHMSDNFEELKPLSHTNKETHSNKDLRIINRKLENMNSSNTFGIVNDFGNVDDFNENNNWSSEEPRLKNTPINQEAETYIDRNKHLKLLNTERYPKINIGKTSDKIDLRGDNVDVVNDIKIIKTPNVLGKFDKQENEIKKSRKDDQKKLTETLENIIDNLNDDISDLKCTTRTLSKKTDVEIKTHDLNDQTKNNIKKANENISTVENSNFDNTYQNVDTFEVFETNQYLKRLSSKQPIEFIRLTYKGTADVRKNKNIAKKMKAMKLMSTANENKSGKNNTNKNVTFFKNILVNDNSVVDQYKLSENKSHEHNSKKHNTSKDNYNHSEIYKDRNSSKTDSDTLKIVSAFENTNSDLPIKIGQTIKELTDSEKLWAILFGENKKTDKNGSINEPDGIFQLGNETSNINTIHLRNTSEFIEDDQNEIINSIEIVNSETCVGVQLNLNTSTESANSGEKTHHSYYELSIGVQDSSKTTEPNLIDRTSHSKNHKSSLDKLIHYTPGILKQTIDSLKSNTIQSLPNPEQDEVEKNAAEPLTECSGYTSHENSTIHYVTHDWSCDSNEEVFNIDRGYNSILGVEKEVPYINLCDQILNENSISNDENEIDYDLSQIKLEQFEDSDDEQNLIIDTDEIGSNKSFEDATQTPIDCITDDVKSDGLSDRKYEYKTDTNESENIKFEVYFNSINSKTRGSSDVSDASETNKEDIEGLSKEHNVPSEENQNTEIIEYIDDDVLSADQSFTDQPPTDEPLTDLEPDGEHFEMDYFYNIIKIKNNLFRVNLHTEDDIFNFIQLYSQRTQTSWGVLESFKSRKYDVRKIFGCLHNGLYKLLKKPNKKMKLKKCECRSEIDIKIKCSNLRGKKSDPYLKNGLPAIVKFKHNHNHFVCKVTELPLLKSITGNSVKIKFHNSLDTSKILQSRDIGNRPKLSPSVAETTNSIETDEEIFGTIDVNASNQSTENNLFCKLDDIKTQCEIVKQSENHEHFKPGQQIINNGETKVDCMDFQLVDTSYSKGYSRKLKGVISNHLKTKWLSDKMTTKANQVSLYKCSGIKCNAAFNHRKTFVTHLNDHCCNTKNQKNSIQFLICVYCFKLFDMNGIDALANHIFDNYNFCNYFCQYCLYRAYTASHVLIHEYMIHSEQKPSILKLKDRVVHDNTKELVKVVDFNKFVLRYVCNIRECTFYSYMIDDFLYHLRQEHVHCDQFYCDICDKRNENGFVESNPIAFVKHFNLHDMNTYQCIFCLFGAEFINIMIIHLAMEHFEYEPLCLERCPINDFCDDKKIENLKILNIKKCIPAGIIKVVNSKSIEGFNKKECQMNGIRQIDTADTCTNTKPFKGFGSGDFLSLSNTDEVISAGFSYQDHLDQCPTEGPIECTFCMAQSESTFDVVELPKLPTPNCFTCTFCNLELPSRDVIKEHVKEIHNISSIEFVPVDTNATNIEKDRFLVREYKCLKRQKRQKRQKRANDNTLFSETSKNVTIAHMKRSKISDNDDSKLTIIEKTTNTLKQQIRPYLDESEQLKTAKRKHPTESVNNVNVVGYKKTPSWQGLYDTTPDVTIGMYFSLDNIECIPQTQYFKESIGYLLCEYLTKVRSNLVSHLNQHKVEPVDSNKQISKSVPCKVELAAVTSKPVNNSSYTSLKAKQNEKIKTDVNRIDDLTLESTIEPPVCRRPKYNIPKFIPANMRFKCPLLKCDYIGLNMSILQNHIIICHYGCFYYQCPHCRPCIKFKNLYELESHFNFHGAELHICQYCDFIHYNRLKIEEHQKLKHPLRKDHETKFNIITIRNSVNPDQEMAELKYNICTPGLKYTQTETPPETPGKLSNACKTSTESLYVSEDHGKILDNPSSEPDDYLKLIVSMAKYVCPVCSVFVINNKSSFRKHLLKEINTTLWKCLECFKICKSAEEMKTHVIKHNQLNQKFKEIEISEKNKLVAGIIEFQNLIIENELLKRNSQHTNCDDQNETKHGNDQ